MNDETNVTALEGLVTEAKQQLQTVRQEYEALAQRRQQIMAALENTGKQLQDKEKQLIEADGILRGVTAAQQRLDATSRVDAAEAEMEAA